jgi:hypothetical protein
MESRYKSNDVWNDKPILRELYRAWWELISRYLDFDRPTVEISPGKSRLKDFFPDLIVTGLTRREDVEACLDAHHLPLSNAQKKNVIMVDVFHHLKEPIRFLKDFSTIACPGDRLILVEPYGIFLSYLIYRLIHHEPFDLKEKFDKYSTTNDLELKGPNQCRAQLIFIKEKEHIDRIFPDMKIVAVEHFGGPSYLLTGGYNYPALIPPIIFKALQRVERHVPSPVMRLIGLKILVVLERI